MLDVNRLNGLIYMDGEFALKFQINLDVTNSRTLFIDLAFNLVVTCIELQEIYGRGFISLKSEELSHKLDFFELSRELNLVRLEYSRLLLHFNHQLIHAFL